MFSPRPAGPDARGRVVRRQHQQQRQQQQEQTSPYCAIDRELPEKQQQTRHSAAPGPAAGGYGADQ